MTVSDKIKQFFTLSPTKEFHAALAENRAANNELLSELYAVEETIIATRRCEAKKKNDDSHS